jgi:uncharacterized protein YhaN
MKLLSLNLKAVGPFTGVVLDFSAGDHGLHLVFGPNEAGKTSAMRALSYLLFEFPNVSGDDFVHPYDQLRVGGRLLRSDGDELEILRRKGRRNTLRGPDDAAPVADEALARFLGGINQDTFEALFGIDHERLTRAGEEIRTGQGRLGELLFAAGAGLAGLRRAHETLQQGLDELFKPRAQNPRINKTLNELRDAQEELKQHQLPGEEWQRHDRSYREAIEESERLRGRIRAMRGDHARLKRIKSAIPIVARRRRLAQERDAMGEVIRLRDDFGDEFREAMDQLRLAGPAIDAARDAIAEIDLQLAGLDPPRELLDAADEVEALRERLGVVEKGKEDRAKRLDNFLGDAEHQARRILRDLGRSTDLDQAETLRLRADEPASIRALGQQFAKLRGQAEEARKTIARHEDQIERLDKDLAELEGARVVEPLRRAVKQARKAGDLDARLAEARGKLARAEKKAATALAQLPGWRRSADELQCLAVPLGATLDLYEARFSETARDRQAIAERLAAEDDAIRQLDAQLQSLDRQHDVPTEEALLAARARRDQGWRLVKCSWLDKAPQVPDLAEFVAEFAPGDTLALAFEQSVHRGDAQADRLRREADRVARKAEWQAQLDQHRDRRAAIAEEGRRLDDRLASIDRDWNETVAPLGIEAEARTPVELRAWLRHREDISQLLEKREEARQAVEPLEEAFAAQRAAVALAMGEVGAPPATSASDLAEVLDHADAAIKRQDDLVQKRSKLETKLASARAELGTARLSLREAETAMDAWQADWASKMIRIGLEPDAAPEQAEVFLTKIGELLEKLHDRRNHMSRIRGIERDADQFAADVAALSARVAPDLADRPAGDQARELPRRLRDAQAADQKRSTMIQQRDRELEHLRLAETRREEARVRLERLCAEADCNEFDQLPEAERRSQNRARLDTDLDACEEQLMVHAAGAEVAGFADEVEQADHDALDASIEEYEAKIAALEEELRRLDQTIGAERGELARMDGGDGAAESAEKAQTLLARLQGDVARYATLKLAASVLNRSIERYREKNQGPILARAGALFGLLTGGSFARLQIDDDGDGHAVVKGVRPDGRLVTVEGMSDGSHDQLYLALRLASLESWLQSHEPIPFIVDDILLNFDDRRATAALEALAELSRRTQVLFFTHHLHMVDLALSHLPRDVVFVHELPGPEARLRLGDQAAK